MSVVSDSSPLIALGRIGRLDLLSGLYSSLIIPPAVHAEVFQPRSVPVPDWIQVRALVGGVPAVVASAELGPGESEAVSLALELKATLLLLDDRAARRLAKSLGLRVTGVGGLLIAAKRSGLVPLVAPVLQSLVSAGFFVAGSVRQEILRRAGE